MKHLLLAAFLILASSFSIAGHHEGVKTEGKTPLVLIARLHALPGQDEEVITLSDAIDKAVQDTAWLY